VQQCMELTGTNRPRACFYTMLFASTMRFPSNGREPVSIRRSAGDSTPIDISIEFRRPWREGNTRLHSEPGSQASQRRWYCAGNCVGE
jgi:hypothetical protein